MDLIRSGKVERIGMSSLKKYASVALVLYENEFILLKRKERDDDPWSGDYCLPGGYAKGGENLMDTAIREFNEETGIETAYLQPVGALKHITPRRGIGIAVHPFIFRLKVKQDIHIGEEIEWGNFVNITEFHSVTDTERGPMLVKGQIIIWGLTYRILENFFSGNFFQETKDGNTEHVS